MPEVPLFELPDKVFLTDYGGNVKDYYEEVYQIFKRDFVDSKPVFEGTSLKLKAYPKIEGKEYTFYHFTHDGEDENNRTPNLRRMECITFPRPMIDSSSNPYLKVWRNERGGQKNILIYHDQEDYLVVLRDRETYILPWTAYLVDYPNRRRKLMEEYKAYKNTETAQHG